MLNAHKATAIAVALFVLSSASAYILASPGEDVSAGVATDHSAPNESTKEELEVTRESASSTKRPPPRPAIIAQLEYGLPRVVHPELALSNETQEAQRLAAGVPNATINQSLDEIGGMMPVNTFIRYNGSKIIGTFLGENSAPGTERERVPDDHATVTMSMIAGDTVGACPDCLVVALNGESVALAWVMHQPWIDAVSISGWYPGTMPLMSFSEAVGNLTRAGKPVFLANGNSVKSPSYEDGFYMSPAIAVTMLGNDGDVRADYTPGADIAALGEGRLPSGDDGYSERRGTSFSAPYAAGNWGRFLMEAWSQGHLERVVEDGRVRNKVVGDLADDHAVLGDGWIDGPEVKALVGSFAHPDPSFRFGSVPLGPLPVAHAWSGYGVLDESAWGRMRTAWEGGFPPIRDPETIHGANLMIRDQGEPVSRTVNGAICAVVEHVGRCGTTRYFENDDWYR